MTTPTENAPPPRPRARSAEEDEGMSFLDHLEEFRGVLLQSVVALVLGCVLVAVFLPFFADALRWPLEFTIGDDPQMLQGLTTKGPFEVFSVMIQVCLLGGLVLALPFILFFVARFVAPGLTQQELAVLRPGLGAAFGLFLVGAAFAFFLLLPATLTASQFFHEMLGFSMIWSPALYYGMVVWMTFGVGLVFEFPLVVLVLVYVGVVTTVQLRKFRPYSVIVFLVVAAMITPTTDPITFLLLAIPMSLLYEASIAVGRRVERWRARQGEEASV